MLVHGLKPHNRARDLSSPKILTPRSFVCIPQRVVVIVTPMTAPRDQGVCASDELLAQVYLQPARLYFLVSLPLIFCVLSPKLF